MSKFGNRADTRELPNSAIYRWFIMVFYFFTDYDYLTLYKEPGQWCNDWKVTISFKPNNHM